MPRTAPPWLEDIRARLKARRLELGLSMDAVAATGAATKKQLTWLESSSLNLYLDQLWPLLVVYDLHPRALFEGVRNEGWSDDLLTYDELSYWVRHALLLLRKRRGLGTPAVAQEAWGGIWCPSTIVRWESGEYRRIDAYRLHLLAVCYGTSLSELLADPRSLCARAA